MFVDPVLNLVISTDLHYLPEFQVPRPIFTAAHFHHWLCLGQAREQLPYMPGHLRGEGCRHPPPPPPLPRVSLRTKLHRALLGRVKAIHQRELPVYFLGTWGNSVGSYGGSGFEGDPALCHEEQEVGAGLYGRVDGGAEGICREGV